MHIIHLNPDCNSSEVAHLLATAPEDTQIVLESAAYSFSKEGVFRGFFAPSNNATGEKHVVFPILNKKHLHINGRGATLTFEDRLFPFILQNCEDVLLENFTIDFSFPRYAVAEIEQADEQSLTLRIDPAQFPFRVKEGTLSFRSGSEWRSTAEKKFFVASLDGRAGCFYLVAGDTIDPLTNLPASVLRTDATLASPDRICLLYRPDSPRAHFVPGQRIVVSHDENRENDVFFLERCQNITLRNIRILRGAGMGVIGQLCHNLTLDGIRIESESVRNEPISITADAFHFLHCSGQLVIRNCTVHDTLDDAVNIHGIYTQAECVCGTSATVRLGHHEQYGFNPYLPGDHVVVLNQSGEFGRLCVRAAHLSPDGTRIYLDFEENAESLLHPGDYLDNPDRMPEILLEGNDFSNCPRVLLGSPCRTVVRNNRLLLHGAVTFTGGIDYWFESGMSKDALIENNDFLCRPDRPHAAVSLEVKGNNHCGLMHQNIVLRGNHLVGFSLLLDAKASENVRIEENTSDSGPCETRLYGCRNVSLF